MVRSAGVALIDAETGDADDLLVALPHRRHERVRDDLGVRAAAGAAARDQLVARLVAERVVDPLDALEIEHHDRARRAGAAPARDVLHERLVDGTPVEQPRELFVVGMCRRAASCSRRAVMSRN
jgi:hypothetical protein